MTYIQHRLNQVRRLMQEQNLAALMVTQPDNVRYLSGFAGDSGGLLITPQHAIISTDSRFWEQAALQAPDYTLHKVLKRARSEWLPDLDLFQMAGGPQRVGFESASISVLQFDDMRSTLPHVEWIKTTDLIEQMRAIKNSDEIATIHKAIEVAEAGFTHLQEVIKPGMTERQAAWELEMHMRTHGAEGVGFEIVVASGPNGAMAHHRPGDRVLRSHEPIIVDWGALVDGYRSDLTRTIILGDGDAKYREIYNVVLRAQETAIHGMKAGLTSKDADLLARHVIEAAGYGDFFGHALGHGVGLAVHELPRVSRFAEGQVLPVGAVVTVEPGIYIPDWGGVRIEDMVMVKEGGVEVLSHLDK